MLQGWKNISYVHWPVPAASVQGRLPEGLFVDTFDGSAWVGLVAFHMQKIRIPPTPPIPYLGTFPETNVRTYVTDAAGRPGVWFDSLDVTRLLPVIVARTSYRLPYMWAKMSIIEQTRRFIYTARRRWPEAPGASSRMVISRGAAIGEPNALERFLTARWGLYTKLGSDLAYAPVEHQPWPLEVAGVDFLHDELVAAAGYQVPSIEPIAHFSRGVDVRIGLPRKVDV